MVVAHEGTHSSVPGMPPVDESVAVEVDVLEVVTLPPSVPALAVTPVLVPVPVPLFPLVDVPGFPLEPSLPSVTPSSAPPSMMRSGAAQPKGRANARRNVVIRFNMRFFRVKI